MCLKILTASCIISAVSFSQSVKYIPKHDELKYTFGGHPPVLKLKPGTVLDTWTEDCYDGAVKKPSDIPSQVAPLGHDNPQTGPFYVEGAQPGDVLAVHILELEPSREYAISSNYPGFGALTGTDYTAILNQPLPEKVWWYSVDRKKRTVSTKLGTRIFEIPMNPFLGCIAVAPQRGEARWTVTPEAYGGNMDAYMIKKGATVYLPVNVEGALLQIGDGHLAQGEGEIIGTAVESALNVKIRVDVIKKKLISWPRIENDEYIMTTGSYRPLEDALRIAYKEMI
ncbi:MAG: acetamidase/formamidase family protein, partial [Bacteroidota bacterium]